MSLDEGTPLFDAFVAAIQSNAARAFELVLIKSALIERVVGDDLDAGVNLLRTDPDGAAWDVSEREFSSLPAEERDAITTNAVLIVAQAIRDATIMLATATTLLGGDVDDLPNLDPDVVVRVAAGLRATRHATLTGGPERRNSPSPTTGVAGPPLVPETAVEEPGGSGEKGPMTGVRDLSAPIEDPAPGGDVS